MDRWKGGVGLGLGLLPLTQTQGNHKVRKLKTWNMKRQNTHSQTLPCFLLDKIILLIKTYLLRNPIRTKNFPPVAGVHIVVVVTNRELVSERHQQIFPGLTSLRQTIELRKFSTSIVFSRSCIFICVCICICLSRADLNSLRQTSCASF